MSKAEETMDLVIGLILMIRKGGFGLYERGFAEEQKSLGVPCL